MRITNNMMVNTSLTNLSRSLNALNKFDTQVQTGKKISTASENPVIASKSLRYRSRLYEIDQYNANVSEANSWLSSTETTLTSSYSILKKMRELIEDCASETTTDSDRNQSIIELKELRSQLGQEANTNVAGRYIFSGFKTDTQVMFNEQTNVSYDIKETLKISEATKLNATEDQTVKAYSMKLLYGTIADDSIKINIGGTEYPSTVTAAGATDEYVIEYVNQADADAYVVPNVSTTGTVTTHTIRVIKDTGEIVFNEKDYNALNNNLDVEYTKDRFDDGDLNPEHYLVCSKKVIPSNSNIGYLTNNRLVIDGVKGIKEGTVKGLSIGGTELIDDDGNPKAGVNVVYTKSTDRSALASDEVRINVDTGEVRLGSDYNARNGQIVSVKQYYNEEINPGQINSTTEIKYPKNIAGSISSDGKLKLVSSGTIDKHSIAEGAGVFKIESYNPATEEYTSIPVKTPIIYANSGDTVTLAHDEVRVNMDTGEMIFGSDFTQGCRVTITSLFTSKSDNVNEEISYEVNSNSNIVVNSLAADVFTAKMIKELDLLINRVTNFDRDDVTEFLGHGLTELDEHLEGVLKETSRVGSKMNRLELISTRLSDDKINFKDLQSENEDVDETEAVTNLALQEMVYNAALSATSKVLQSSLLDFLQ